MECQCSEISSIPLRLKQWILKICFCSNIEPPTGNILDVKECTLLAEVIFKNYHIALECLNLPENTIICSESVKYEYIKELLVQSLLRQYCRYTKDYNESNFGSQLLFLLELYIHFYGKGIGWYFWKNLSKAGEPFPLTYRKCHPEWTVTFQKHTSNERLYPSKFPELWNLVSKEPTNCCDVALISLIRDSLHPKEFIAVEKQNVYGNCHIYPQKWKHCERAVYLQQKVNSLMAFAYQTMTNATNYNVVGNCIQKMSIPEYALKIYLSKDDQQRSFYKNIHKTATMDNTITNSNKESNTQNYSGRAERFKANMERKEEEVKKKAHHAAINGTCAQIVTDILDISMEMAEYRSRGETISNHDWEKWRELFCRGEEVTSKWQDSLSDLITKKRDLREIAERCQEMMSKMELEEYIERRGKWESKYISPRAPNSQPFLANILINLLNLKQTTQETRALIKYPVTAIVVGLEDLKLMQIICQLLNEKKVLPILPSEVLSSCISNYLHVTANVPREDCSLWGRIREHLNSVETSQKYSRQFKNCITSELKKLSLLGEMLNEENNIWNNNISSRDNKFTLNTESKDGNTMVYEAKLTKDYCKIKKLELEKPSKDANLSRKPLDMLSIKYESGNGMDKEVQYGRLAYQSLCLGGNIEDSILVGMILECVREMDPEEGWVLFNFPETKQQAVILEEALTGRKVPWLQEEEYYIQGEAVPSSELHKLVDMEKSGRMGSILVNIQCLAKEEKWKSYFNRYINASPLQEMNPTPLGSFYKKEKIFYPSFLQDATKVQLEEIIRLITEVEKKTINNDGILWPSSNEKSSPILAEDCAKVASKTLSEESTAENTRTLLNGVQSRCPIKEPSHLNWKMPNTIRHMLAHFWEVLENDFQTKINLMLLGLRRHYEVHIQCLSSIQRHFCTFVKRPGELQVSLNRFQILLTAFDDDAKNDSDIANYLFTKWWEMKEEMHRTINEMHKENLRFLNCLLKNMTESDCSLSSIYLIGLEAEVSRCSKTLQIINDYYHVGVKGRPSGFRSKWFYFVPLTKWNDNSNVEKHPENQTKMTRDDQKDAEKIARKKETKSEEKKRDRSKKRKREENRKTEKEANETKSQKQKKSSLVLECKERNLEKQMKGSEMNTQITEAIISSWGKEHISIDKTLTRFQYNKEKLEENGVIIQKYIEDLERKIQKRAEERHCKDKKSIKKKKKEGASNEELQLSSDSSSSDTEISILKQDTWKEKAEDVRVWVEWKGAVEEEVERTKQAVDSLRGAFEEDMTNLQRELSTLVQSFHSTSEKWLKNERQRISLASEYLLHAILKKAKRCHYISLRDMEGGWLLAQKSTAPYTAPTSATTCFCLCQLDHLRCIFIQSFPKGLIQNNSFASILYKTTKMSICFREEHYMPKLWTQLTHNEMEKIVQECFGKCNWVNWRDFLMQALTLPKPTVGDLVDAVNKFRQLDASLLGSLPFEDYSNVILWFEREVELDDIEQTMVNSLEMPTKAQWEKSKLPTKFKTKANEGKQRGEMGKYKEEKQSLKNQIIKHPSLEKGIQKGLNDPPRVHRLIKSNEYVRHELPLANSSPPKRIQSEPKGMTSGEKMMANGRHSKTGIRSEEIPTEIAASGCEMKRGFECSMGDEPQKEGGNGKKTKSTGAERSSCFSDTSIVKIKMVKRQLFETFREKNGRVNYMALLLAFCKDEDTEEGLRKAISLFAGRIVHRKHNVIYNTTTRFSKRRGSLEESVKMADHPTEEWTIEGDDKKRIHGEDLRRKEVVREDAENSESMDLHSSPQASDRIAIQAILPSEQSYPSDRIAGRAILSSKQSDNLTVSMHNELNVNELEQVRLCRNPGHTLINTSAVASTAKLRVEFRKKLGQFQCHQPMWAFKSCSIGHLDLGEITSHTINKLCSDSFKGREDPHELRKYHLDENADVPKSSCLMPTQVRTNIDEESLWRKMDTSPNSAPCTEIGKSQYPPEKSTTSGRSESCVQWEEFPREENCLSAQGIRHTHNGQEDSLRELSGGIDLERKKSKMSLSRSLVESPLVAANIHFKRRGGSSIHERKQIATSSKVALQKGMAVRSPPVESVPMRRNPKQCRIGEDETVGEANPLTAQAATVDLSVAAKGLKEEQKALLSLHGQETIIKENWTFLKRPHDTTASILIVDSKNLQRLWLGKQRGCQECGKSLPSRMFTLKESKGRNGARKEEESEGKSAVVKEVLEEMELCSRHKFKMHIALQLICNCLKNLSPEISEGNSNISIYYQKIVEILRNEEENRCYLQQEIDLSYLRTLSIFKTFQKLNMFKQLDVNGIINKIVMRCLQDNIQKGE